MNYKHNYIIIINLLSILTLLVTFSCSDNKNVLMEKELPELLGTGTTIQIAPVEAWREKQDEMHSIHKRNLDIRENRLRANLEKGMRLGVVAGSDMHRLTMGHLCKEPGEIWSGNRSGWDQTAGLQATFASGH